MCVCVSEREWQVLAYYCLCVFVYMYHKENIDTDIESFAVFLVQ